jgi:signal transduction histidine kinase
MSARPRTPVDRSVFRRLALITTVMVLVILTIFTAFFALTVRPPFDDAILNRRLQRMHALGILPTLALITSVVIVAHVFVLRLLRPLRELAHGVTRLTGGDLDVVIKSGTRDEFATLTSGFNQMVTRVREMIGARDQLLQDVSHELRSPITRMKVALELLPDSDVRTRMALDVREMEAMVAELLELERLRDGRAIHKETFDLVLLVRNLVASFSGRTPEVQLRAAADRLDVHADARTIGVVIRNLLDNAVTHSLADSGPVVVAITGEGDTVTVAVSDDGPGIPESEAANVFEPFYRIDRSRSRRTGGYGLGLSICKRVIDAHAGRIEVRPRSPRGTTFVVTLPRS